MRELENIREHRDGELDMEEGGNTECGMGAKDFLLLMDFQVQSIDI